MHRVLVVKKKNDTIKNSQPAEREEHLQGNQVLFANCTLLCLSLVCLLDSNEVLPVLVCVCLTLTLCIKEV